MYADRRYRITVTGQWKIVSVTLSSVIFWCRFPLAASGYGFPAAEQLMQRERKHGMPPVPGSFEELNRILESPQWVIFKNDTAGQPLYREVCVAEDGTQCAIFLSSKLQDLMAVRNWTAHADGTFGSRPKRPASSQLFSLHVVDRDAYGDKKRVKHTRMLQPSLFWTDEHLVKACFCLFSRCILLPMPWWLDALPVLTKRC